MLNRLDFHPVLHSDVNIEALTLPPGTRLGPYEILAPLGAGGMGEVYRAKDSRLGREITTNFQLWAFPTGADRKPIPVLRAGFGVSHGQFSPDGRWVAYSSNESGKWEIFVAPFPGPGGNWKVSTAGGFEPRWRRDGKELYYIAPDGKLMVVEVKPGPTFEAGGATPLFQTRRRVSVSATDLFSYDVSADGQRFLINTDVGELTSTPLTVVSNWTAGLKR